MKKIYLFIALAFSTLGTAQGTESFENITGTGSTSSYDIQTWTGDNGEEWSATDARRDQTLTDKAVLVRTGVLTGALTAQQATAGIGELTFDYKIPFSDATKDITVEIAAGTATYTYNIGTLQQNTVYNSINIPLNVQNATSLTLTVSSTPSGARLIIDNLVWTAYQAPAAPAFMVSSTTISELDYNEGEGPSTSASLTLSGEDMDGTDVTLTASEYFELSSDNISFSETLSLAAYNGEETTVYVRLKAALTVDTYAGTVTIAGAGAENLTVNLNGEVTAAASVKQDNIEGLAIYPNPARDIITVASNSSAVKNIIISDITGKKVIETATAQNVDVTSLKAGVYIIHIAQEGKTALRKLVIK